MESNIRRIISFLLIILPNMVCAQKIIVLPVVETNSHVQSLLIKSIELTSDYTIVNIRFVSDLFPSGYIRTYKPGDNRAYYISDNYGNRIAELKNVKNLLYYPNKRTVKPNEIVDFALIFGPIKDKISKIDIIEGNTEDQTNFNFYGVHLNEDVADNEKSKEIGQNQVKKVSSTGTGFLINSDGYVATNFHVVDGALDIELVFPEELNSVPYKAKVVLSDKTNDLAILKINDTNFKKIEKLPYELSDDYAVGEEIFTIGYPQPDIMGTESKLTTGIINALSGIDNDNTCMQISVSVQPGNSGGPLFNSKGNIVGITTSSLNSLFMLKYKGNIPQNVNYAVKTEYLQILTKSLLLDGENIIKDLPLKDKIKAINNYVCLIKTFK